LKLPKIFIYGTKGEHADSTVPWEPHVLLETGYKRTGRPESAQDLLAAVNSADYSARRYCTKEIEGMTFHSNKKSCNGGSNRDIAYRVTHTFSVNNNYVFNFRFGMWENSFTSLY
jgi:hypothetical protein